VPSKNPAQRLLEIVDNIDAILEFVAGLDFAQFQRDRKTVYAVVRALEIISEASRRLPIELQQRHPSMDWVAIAAAGNIYRHEYDAVDEVLLWNTITRGLSSLRSIASAELDSMLHTPEGT